MFVMQWEKTDDKLAIVGLGFAGVIILWASVGLIAVSSHKFDLLTTEGFFLVNGQIF